MSIIKSVLVFGDTYGIPQILKLLSVNKICGLVSASIRQYQHPELQEIAKTNNLPFLIQPIKKSPHYLEFVEQIYSLNPDLILVNSYSMLLHSEILKIPLYGGVNIHAALLPQYRGCNPIQYALLNNETQTGVTMHYMNEEFDAGDIINQKQVPIYFEDTWVDIQKRIITATEIMLAEELPKLLQQTNDRYPQDESQAYHYKRRYPEDGLIDWTKSVLYIYNLIRALVKPHPGAFYYDQTEKVILEDYLSIPQVTSLKYSVGGLNLQSGNILLSPLNLADLPVIFNWINEIEQVLFNAPYKPITEAQHQTWFNNIQQKNDLVIFAIRLLETKELIGTCQLHSINYIHRSGELQICLSEVSKNGTEAIRLLLNFAFKDLNLHRVYLHVFNTNVVAIKVYEKVGFTPEGRLRQAVYIDGQYIDVLIMGILRDEYIQL